MTAVHCGAEVRPVWGLVGPAVHPLVDGGYGVSEGACVASAGEPGEPGPRQLRLLDDAPSTGVAVERRPPATPQPSAQPTDGLPAAIEDVSLAAYLDGLDDGSRCFSCGEAPLGRDGADGTLICPACGATMMCCAAA
jgi:hypothetical protein